MPDDEMSATRHKHWITPGISWGNIGTILAIIGLVLSHFSDAIQKYDTLQNGVASINQTLTELRTGVSDVKDDVRNVKVQVEQLQSWKSGQVDGDNSFRAQTTTRFDQIDRRLDQLDWSIGHQSDGRDYPPRPRK